jgi:hypothetical protein
MNIKKTTAMKKNIAFCILGGELRASVQSIDSMINHIIEMKINNVK